MATYAAKQLYLPAGADWSKHIGRARDQLMKGHPLFIWHGDGILAYLCADPERNLMTSRWVAHLLRCAADEIDTIES